MATYQDKNRKTDKEIARDVGHDLSDTVDILPSSVPSSSIMVTVPEPKVVEKSMAANSEPSNTNS